MNVISQYISTKLLYHGLYMTCLESRERQPMNIVSTLYRPIPAILQRKELTISHEG